MSRASLAPEATTPDPSPSRARRAVAPVVVWGTWAAMLAAGLGYVARYGSNVPSWDGWDMVPTATGEQPVTASWLWSQHNEHRVPVPRLVMLAIYKVAGIDFRYSQCFNVLVTAALALGMIAVARLRRGRTDVADAFFPLLLLNLGQGLNFIWAWQVEFFVSTALAGLLLLVVVGAGERPRPRSGAWAAALLVLLVLCGAHGMVLVPFPALWLAVRGWRLRASPDGRDRRGGLLLMGLAGLAVAVAGLYLVGYQAVPGHNEWPMRPRTFLKTTLQFVAMGFGSAILPWWPWPDLVVAAMVLASVAVLVVAARRPDRRVLASGLLAFLAAMGCLAAAVGRGRYHTDPRYITLSVPALACVYFIWDVYGPPRAGRAVRLLLCLAALACLWPNTREGLAYARDLRGRLGSFERDMVAGEPPYRLIRRHAPSLHIHNDLLADYMPMLRRAGVGAFRSLRDDPRFVEAPVPLVPARADQVVWDPATRTARLEGPSPSLVFDLGEDRYVDGIRIRYRHSSPEGIAPCVALAWKKSDERDFPGSQKYANNPTGDRANWEKGSWSRLGDAEATMTAWPCAPARQIAVFPDIRPGTFEIVELVLLVRDGG